MLEIKRLKSDYENENKVEYVIEIDGVVISKFWHDPKLQLHYLLKTASCSLSGITHSPEHND